MSLNSAGKTFRLKVLPVALNAIQDLSSRGLHLGRRVKKNTDQRPPFEKVKFHSDVKTIYSRSVREAIDFYCKNENDPMFGFKPESYNEKWGLFGQVIKFEDPPPAVSDNVVVNFQLGEDRYFTKGEFRPLSENAVLRMTGSLYRLERRGQMRVSLEAAEQKDCNIILRGRNTVFLTAEILNISQGGMRLRLPLDPNTPAFKTGEIIRFFIHINQRWRVESEGVIRHAKSEENDSLFGVQFTSTNDSDRRKLISLMMELQRRYSIE